MHDRRMLPCKLSDTEVATRAADLAKQVAELDKVETRKKTANEGFKHEMEYISGDIRRLAAQVRTGTEDREVDVDYHHDGFRFVVETIRLDTGEVIDTRPMTKDEQIEARQEALPAIGKPRRTRRHHMQEFADISGATVEISADDGSKATFEPSK